MNHERGIVLYFEINILKPTMRAFSPKKVSETQADTDAIVRRTSHLPAILIREYDVLLYYTR